MYAARKIGLSIFLLGSALVLTACSGSSSSGAAAFAGTYTVSGTASASDGTSATRALESVVVVDDSGNVTVDPDTANVFNGTISGNDISAVIAGSRLNSPGLGISCTGCRARCGGGVQHRHQGRCHLLHQSRLQRRGDEPRRRIFGP